MRIILFVTFLIIINLSAFSQDRLIVLHQVIGDTIDKQEQQAFLLFSDILDQNFISATIHFENEKYIMHINSASGLKFVDIKEEYIVENSKHVDKLVRYFKSLVEKKDSLNIEEKIFETCLTFQTKIITNDQRKIIATEARTYFNLNQDAEELGLSGLDKDNYIKVNSKSWLAEMLFDILK